jgi:hypothetical protein
MQEEWRQVDGFPAYEVSTLGRVRSWHKISEGRVLTGGRDRNGYRQLVLMQDGHRKIGRVCRLVAIAFIGTPPDGHEIRHLDGDNTNDDVRNLAWGTPAENAQDRIRHGTSRRGELHGRARLTADDVRDIRANCTNVALTARQLGVSESCVRDARSGKNWSWLDA